MHTPSGEFSATPEGSQPKVVRMFGWGQVVGRGIWEMPIREENDLSFVGAEKFVDVFHKADHHDDGGARHADEKHNVQNVHREQTESHEVIVNRRKGSVNVKCEGHQAGGQKALC